MFYTWFGGHQMTVIEADGVSRSASVERFANLTLDLSGLILG